MAIKCDRDPGDADERGDETAHAVDHVEGLLKSRLDPLQPVVEFGMLEGGELDFGCNRERLAVHVAPDQLSQYLLLFALDRRGE